MISANTYEELYEILRLMDKQSVMKIPIDILKTIKEQRNPKYKTRIDKNDIFNEKNVNKETIDLLCYLDYHYWMDENKKVEVDRIRKQMLQEEDNKKRKQYNPNDLFKKDETIDQADKNNSNTILLVEQKNNSLLIKFKNFIFKMLHINK